MTGVIQTNANKKIVVAATVIGLFLGATLPKDLLGQVEPDLPPLPGDLGDLPPVDPLGGDLPPVDLPPAVDPLGGAPPLLEPGAGVDDGPLEPMPVPAIDPAQPLVPVPAEPDLLTPPTGSALLPDFVTDSANLAKVLDRIRLLVRRNDHVAAQALIDATLQEFGVRREYAFYMRNVRREQNNLWYEMAQKAMKDKEYALARSLLDRYRKGVKREMEDRQQAGQIKFKETKEDVSLVGKLVRELEQARKNLAEARAKAGEPDTDLAPNFDQIMAEERRLKEKLSAKAEKLLVKAQKDAADGQYQLAHSQIDEALTLLPRDVSTIALVSDLYKEKERVVWFQMGEAMQKGQVSNVSRLIADYQRAEHERRDAETITPGIPLEEQVDFDEIQRQAQEHVKRQVVRARQLLSESRDFLDRASKLKPLERAAKYTEAKKRLFSISTDLEPNHQTWPIIREAAMELNRINLLKAEDARHMKDWATAREFTEEYRKNLYQKTNLVENPSEPERPGLTEKERDKEVKRSERINEKIDKDMKKPSSRDITEFNKEWPAEKEKEREALMQGRVRFLAGDLTGAVEAYRMIETRYPDNNEAKAMLRRISVLRETNSYLGYQKTRAEMFEWIRYEWELPKVFDRQLEKVGEVQSRESPILAKLKRIEIPGVNFFETPLSEVMTTLTSYARANDLVEIDPAAKGVNIVTLIPEGQAAPQVTIQLNKMNLEKMLDFITEMVGWTYEVRTDAVVVSKEGGEQANIRGLEIEFFPVSQGTVQRMTGGVAPGGGAPDPFAPPGGGGGANDQAEKLKQFIIDAGVDFDEAKGHKFVFDGFQIIATNTRRNLDKLNRLLTKLDADANQQVEIETKFLEVQQGAMNEIHFDWNIKWGVANPLFDPRTGLPQIDANGEVIMNWSKNIDGNTRTLSQAHSTAAFGSDTTISFPNNPQSDRSFPNPAPTLPGGISVGTAVSPLLDLTRTSVLSSGQSQLLVSALNRKQGTDLLSAPRITVMDGQPASITIAQEFIYPVNWTPAPLPQNQGFGASIPLNPAQPQFGTVAPDDEQPGFREVGVELDVTPRVESQYNSINLELNPKVTEFDGFIEYGGRSAQIGMGLASPTIIQPSGILMPIFSVRKVNTSVTIFDGATVIIGGLTREEIKTVQDKIPFLGDIPVLGNLFRSNAESYSKRNLMIFVTASIVSRGGSPTRERIQSIDDSSIFRHPVLLTPTGPVRRNFREIAP